MNRPDFEAYLERQFEAIRALNATKGRDYTGDGDALANLRDMPQAGITGRQKWIVYFDKHMRAIETYVREGQVESEPVETRIQDAVLYLLLLGALVEEEVKSQYAYQLTALGQSTLKTWSPAAPLTPHASEPTRSGR